MKSLKPIFASVLVLMALAISFAISPPGKAKTIANSISPPGTERVVLTLEGKPTAIDLSTTTIEAKLSPATMPGSISISPKTSIRHVSAEVVKPEYASTTLRAGRPRSQPDPYPIK